MVEEQMNKTPGGLFSFEQMQMIAKTIPILLDDDEERTSVQDKFTAGLNILSDVSEEFPEIAEEAAAGAQLLVMGVFQIVSEIVDKQMHGESARLAPLTKQNEEKQELIKMARSLAEEMWVKDTAQKIRIGEMTAYVYSALYEKGFQSMLPSNQDAVKDWIKLVAPAYARKGGKPKKTG